jgi:hypothetical protein
MDVLAHTWRFHLERLLEVVPPSLEQNALFFPKTGIGRTTGTGSVCRDAFRTLLWSRFARNMPTPLSVSYLKLNVEGEAMVHWTRKKALRHVAHGLCLPWNNAGSRQVVTPTLRGVEWNRTHLGPAGGPPSAHGGSTPPQKSMSAF